MSNSNTWLFGCHKYMQKQCLSLYFFVKKSHDISTYRCDKPVLSIGETISTIQVIKLWKLKEKETRFKTNAYFKGKLLSIYLNL